MSQQFNRRDIFLKIERVVEYSPLAPEFCARRYDRDCQFNEGRELGRIPAEEILFSCAMSPFSSRTFPLIQCFSSS